MEDVGIGPFDSTRWLPAWWLDDCDDKDSSDEVDNDEETSSVCGDCTAEEVAGNPTDLAAMIAGCDANVTGAKATDEATDKEETSEDEGIVTAASETTAALPRWSASPPPVTPTPFTGMPSPPLTPFVSNWVESITAVTANWALAESSVKREVGWDEKERWRSLPEPPRWFMWATAEETSWFKRRASCSLCISINCSRWQLKLSRLNSWVEGEEDLELNVERCRDRSSSCKESSSGGGVWGL